MKPRKQSNYKKYDPLAKKRSCYFCVNEVRDIDFKDTQILRRFISSYMKIVPKRRSGSCSKHQRKIAEAIKRARFMAMLPFVPR